MKGRSKRTQNAHDTSRGIKEQEERKGRGEDLLALYKTKAQISSFEEHSIFSYS